MKPIEEYTDEELLSRATSEDNRYNYGPLGDVGPSYHELRSAACDCVNCGSGDGYLYGWRVDPSSHHLKSYGTRWVKGKTVIAPCPVCAGSEEDYLRTASGLDNLVLDKRLARDVRLDQFEEYQGKTEAKKMTALFVHSATGGEQKVQTLFLWGKYGRGKTHLLFAAANMLIMAGVRVRYTKMETILNELRASFNESNRAATRDSADAIRKRYSTVPVLFLDEIDRANYDSAWVSTEAFGLIDDRKLAGLPIMAASNKSLEEMAQSGETLAAIASRLGEGLVSELSGDDVREIHGAVTRTQARMWWEEKGDE